MVLHVHTKRLTPLALAIRSGGQTGVDRAALEVAAALGVAYCGWCPNGGLAEDAPTPPGIRAKYPLLSETPSADPRQRTAWNVRDSDATIIIADRDLTDSPGAEFTRVSAELIFVRPLLVVRIDAPAALDEARHWLTNVARGATLDLNVAGPRESEAPGIGVEAFSFLRELCAERIV